MTFTELRKVCEKDEIILAIFSYKNGCSRHIHSLKSDPDLMAHFLSAEWYMRYLKFMKQETFDEFMSDLFQMIEENMPSISGLDREDALRIAYWFAEAQQELVKTSHHKLYEAHCKIRQQEQNPTLHKKSQRNLRFKQ